MRRLWNGLTMMAYLWLALACGGDADERIIGDTPSARRTPTARCIGTVALSAEAAEERLPAQLSREEVTMADIRSGCARYCQ